MLFSLPYFRRVAYECFLRAHQGLAALLFYAMWRHIPANRLLPRLCLYVSLGSLALTSLSQLLLLCYQNAVFTTRGFPRAYVYNTDEDQDKREELKREQAIMVRISLPCPMKLDAGQYIYLWMPTVSLFSWAQTHPFMVTSWSRQKQTTLDLYMKVQRGLTATLLNYARTAPDGSVSFASFVTGPHGVSKPTSQYESVLLIASGSGIAATLPYVKKLIYGYNTSVDRTRRVHLVWQLKTLGKCVLCTLFNVLTDQIWQSL